MNKSVVLRRFLAAIIDWNLFGLPIIIYTNIFDDVFLRPSFQHSGHLLALVLLVVLMYALFILKDAILGRSIGKRILGLYILDETTKEIASKKQRIIKNLFFFILPIEIIVLIATKKTLGDSLANTVVVKK